jgi:hypothetical protein
MAYSGAKLLARELRRAPADVKAFAMEKLITALVTDDETRLDLVVRLLVLVMVAEPAVRRDAALSDAPRVLLERLERFLAERKKRAAVTQKKPRGGKRRTAAEDATRARSRSRRGGPRGSYLALHKLSEWRDIPRPYVRGDGGDASDVPGCEKLGSPDGYLDAATRARAAAACVRLLELTAVGGEESTNAAVSIPAPESFGLSRARRRDHRARAHVGRGGGRRAGGDAAAGAPDQGPRDRGARARRGRRRLDSGPAGALRLPRVRRARRLRCCVTSWRIRTRCSWRWRARSTPC